MNSAVNWIDFDRCHYIKSGLLETKRQATRPRKKVYANRSFIALR